jgi:hypothetical protein
MPKRKPVKPAVTSLELFSRLRWIDGRPVPDFGFVLGREPALK